MTEIRVCGRREIPTNCEERETLEREATTSKVLNGAAKEGHVVDMGVHVHGDDASYGETKARQKGEAYREKIEVAKSGVETALDIGGLFSEHIELVADTFGLAMIPVGLGLATYNVFEANAKGKELKDALAKDAMHLALLDTLKGLPSEWTLAERARRPEAGSGWHSGEMRVRDQLASTFKSFVPLLQLRCDEGMKAAMELPRGMTVAQYVDAHPDVRARWEGDAAFRAGFDAMHWALERAEFGNDKAPLEQMMRGLGERDARAHYEVRVQG